MTTTFNTNNRLVKVGDVQRGKLNIITDFNPTIMADVIDKLPYADVTRRMSLDDKDTQWGIAVSIKSKDLDSLKNELPKIINNL